MIMESVRAPRFSVVVPAYNASSTLAETLEYVGNQDVQEWECVVVDDGSTDDTSGIAESFRRRDPRYSVVRQSNKGTAGAYNTGVSSSSGDYIVICSADDLLLPHHLSVMSSVIDANPGYGIYSSNGEYLYESGERDAVYKQDEWRVRRSLTFEEVLDCCFFSVGAVFARGAFDAVDGFREGVYGEDYDFWLRVMATGIRQLYTPEVLSLHRVSASQKSFDMVRVYESNIEVYQHLLDAHLVGPEEESTVEKAIATRAELLRMTLGQRAHEMRREQAKRLLAPMLRWSVARRALTTAAKAVERVRGMIGNK